MKKKSRELLAVVLLTGVLAAPVSSLAGTVTYSFSGGGFTFQNSGGVILPAELSGLSTFSGAFTIDDSVTDQNVANASMGVFSGAAIALSALFNTGIAATGAGGHLYQSRSTSPFGDLSSWTLDAFASRSISLAAGLSFVGLNLFLTDSDSGGQALFTDPNIMLAALPSPAVLNAKYLEMIFQDASRNTVYIRGTLASLQRAVPEPGTLALAGLGLLGIGVVRRRKASRASKAPFLKFREGRIRMRKTIHGCLVGTLLLGPLPACAASVVVDGRAWRQLTDTMNLSWNQVATVCNPTTGVCSGSLGAVDFSGWTWADNATIRDLFDKLIKPLSQQFPLPTSSYTAANDPDIDAAISNSTFLPTGTTLNWEGLFGWSRTTDPGDSNYAYFPLMANYFSSSIADEAYLGVQAHKSSSDPVLGAWLFRSVDVAEPGTLALIGFGLAGLGLMRRPKAN